MKLTRTFVTAVGIAVIVATLPMATLVANAGGGPTCFGSPAPGETRNIIIGTNQSETLVGTPAADLIIGRRGKDTIMGLAGADLICGSEDSNPKDGDDLIRAGAGFDTLVGGKGDDDLFGGEERDNLFGGGGDDLVKGGPNEPGVGDEANYFFAPRAIVANLAKGSARGEGKDELVGIEGLGGSSGHDRLVGDNGDNSFDGLGGNDEMLAGRGIDTLGLTFANGNMFVNLRGGTSVGDGMDRFKNMENVIGSSYNDYITGTGGPNVFLGSDGHDTMYGRGADDIMLGFAGQDQMFGGVGVADFVSYSDRPDLAVDLNLRTGSVTRSDGNDGLEGVEMVEGSSMNDQITGDNGPNFFYSDDGDDTIDGNGGSDLIFFLGAQNDIRVDLLEGTAMELGGGSDTLEGIENVVGSNYADRIKGDHGRNFLNGGQGNDQIYARGGNDYLAGGGGNDSLVGRGGRNDLVDFFQSRNPVTVVLAFPSEAVGEGVDDLSGIEAVSGSSKGDTLRGSHRANALYGVGGSDELFGLAGDDRLDGGRSVDSLTGGPDSDKCFKKAEAVDCESFARPNEHPVSEVGRRYKKAVAAARRYKRRYK